MRPLILILSLIGITTTMLAQKSITFEVCKVETTDKLIKTKPYNDVLVKYFINSRRETEKPTPIPVDTSLSYLEQLQLSLENSIPQKKATNHKLEAAPGTDKELIESGFHPFVATMHQAYAKHYPMTISPDMIWLLIAQGFAAHVNENAEELRDHFVDFDGKKKIHIRRDQFVKGSDKNDWPGAFDEFSKKIEANTGAELLELVTGGFSTTGATEKIAFQVTLMDAMKSYFLYSMSSICGIPKITLEGTPEDWEKIEQKAKELAQYDLEWWINDLEPILKEFTKASKGNVNKAFWKDIYKLTAQGSGSTIITGWVLHLFPYLKYGDKFVRKEKYDLNVKGKTLNVYQATTSNFPNGVSAADFLWDYHGAVLQMEFVAGFVGSYQDPKTCSLRPEISWAVVDKQLKATDEMIENYEKGGNKEYRDFMKAKDVKAQGIKE